MSGEHGYVEGASEVFTLAGPPTAFGVAPILNEPLAWSARAVRVDNPGPQWLHITGTKEYIPPGVTGAVRPIPATDFAQAEWTAPYGQQPPADVQTGASPVVGAVSSTVQVATLTFYSDEYDPDPGTLAPATPAPIILVSSKSVAGNNSVTGLNLPSRSKCIAFVLSLSAGAITNLKVNGPMGTPFVALGGPIAQGVVYIPVGAVGVAGSPANMSLSFTDSAGGNNFQVWALPEVPPAFMPQYLGAGVMAQALLVTVASDQPDLPIKPGAAWPLTSGVPQVDPRPSGAAWPLSAGGGPIAVVGDSSAPTTGARVLAPGDAATLRASLLVWAVQSGLTGATLDILRTANVFKTVASVAITAGTPVTVWTPAAGKKFRVLGFALGASVATAIILLDSAAEIARQLVPAATSAPSPPMGNGILSVLANNTLKLNVSTSATINGFVFGTEE